jgi:uncharacterized protein
MSPEERQILSGLFERVRTASATPRDREAEELIDRETRQQPYATYYLAQAVVVQEKGLEAAANRIRELEDHIHALEADHSEHHRAEQGGGFLSSIFGSSQPQQQAPVPSSGPWAGSRQSYGAGRSGYDDGYRSPPPTGPWSGNASGGPSAGSSFLTGALGTAAGVAGGMLLAHSLSGIFASHMASAGLGNPLAGASAFGIAEDTPVEETVVNKDYDDDAIRTVADNQSDADERLRLANYEADDDADEDRDDSLDI